MLEHRVNSVSVCKDESENGIRVTAFQEVVKIPLEEASSIVCDSLFEGKTKVKKLTKTQFKELLNFAVKESPFQFNNKLYKQVDGVAMGNPLAPSLANCFMCFHEES